MGIDVFTKWDKIKKKEKDFQLEVAARGKDGYLREGYMTSKYYPTKILLQECFEIEYDNNEDVYIINGEKSKEAYISIPSKTLIERLPETIEACIKRYGYDLDKIQNYIDFVRLITDKEGLGLNPKILVSY